MKAEIRATMQTEQMAALQEGILEGSQHAMSRVRDYLLSIQAEDGHWRGELEGDTILESEYILTMHFIGRTGESRVRKAANYLVEKALPEGGWAIYPGGPAELSASVKAYFVLKLVGHDANVPYMQKARRVILELGGLAATNSFTRLYLAIFGQIPWERCPAVPPELILLPTWFPVNLYEISAWSRGIVVPLSVIWATKPYCPVPEHARIQELWIDRPPRYSSQSRFWCAFFKAADGLLRFLERHKMTPWRKRALQACERWMVEHFEKSNGIGSIFPPIVNSIIALRCLGYSVEHPYTQSQIKELEKLEIEERDTLRLAPCFSPVWDTALMTVALAESGLEPAHPSLQKAAEWLLTKEVCTVGDWKIKNPVGQPGGWYFEYANEFYPDVDDTLQVLTALTKMDFLEESSRRQKAEAIDRGLRWVLTMQNIDGGWASFDRGCNREFLTQIPFADHNAMIDPSTSDITGRGLESLAALGFTRNDAIVRKALHFLYKEQESDGTWFGRWGCNYIYGTWLALRGLQCIGEDMHQPRLQKAAHWLRLVQNDDGGWGESHRSYELSDEKGRGPSTPSQTAWALLGLMATGDYRSLSVRRGIEFLIRTQKGNGSWKDEFWTATGFPKVFCLRYHLYASYFPLQALGQYLRQVCRSVSPEAGGNGS
jgi:squalene-hopene/tetraprenyl-beta-curcumene cyclase